MNGYPFDEIIPSYKQKDIIRDGKTRNSFRERFSCFFEKDLEWFESMKHVALPFPGDQKVTLNAGQIIMIKSDLIHRGVGCEEEKDRNLLFFTLMPKNWDENDEDVKAELENQYRADGIAGAVYSTTSSEYFEIIQRMNDPTVVPDVAFHASQQY